MLKSSSLFRFKHGDHVCIFHRSEDALMEVLTPHFAEGLRNGERCFGIQKSRVIKRLFNELRFLGVEPDDEVKRGALVLRTDDVGYFENGKFEPERMIDMLMKTIDDSVKQGFSGFRSAGDLSWAAQGRRECNQIIGYEEMVEKSYPGKPAIGLCQYPLKEFPVDVLDSVLAFHKIHLMQESQAHASLSLGYEGHVAEIVSERFADEPRYNYVVQDRKSHDCVGWGTAPDFHSASENVDMLVRSYGVMN